MKQLTRMIVTLICGAFSICLPAQRTFCIEDHREIAWEKPHSQPVIMPPFPSPIIADPTFLTPDLSPDSQWHLFAHTIFGIRHYTSEDGMKWKKAKHASVVKKAQRAFIIREHDTCYLLYEKVDKYAPYASHIEMIKGRDLYQWSKPIRILGPDEHYSREGAPKGSVSNACIVRAGEGYRLYFSAGLVWLRDCGFSEPRYICYASAPSIEGPYTWAGKPLICPDSGDPYRNAGAGAMKVYKTSDGYVGYENGIAILKDGHSYSSLSLLVSTDGISWEKAAPEPFLKPTTGWQRDYVYALDLRFCHNRFYLFYNARRGHHWSAGRECIGMISGSLK